MNRKLKAMRLKCIDCCGGSHSEVRLCELTKCPLHEFRMGTDPFRKPRQISSDQRADLIKRLPKATVDRDARIQVFEAEDVA